jgi:hypothetical protein
MDKATFTYSSVNITGLLAVRRDYSANYHWGEKQKRKLIYHHVFSSKNNPEAQQDRIEYALSNVAI